MSGAWFVRAFQGDVLRCRFLFGINIVRSMASLFLLLSVMRQLFDRLRVWLSFADPECLVPCYRRRFDTKIWNSLNRAIWLYQRTLRNTIASAHLAPHIGLLDCTWPMACPEGWLLEINKGRRDNLVKSALKGEEHDSDLKKRLVRFLPWTFNSIVWVFQWVSLVSTHV